MTKGFIFAQFVWIFAVSFGYLDEENLPTKCHVCKHMTRELSEILGQTDKSHDVLYMGQVFQNEPKKVPYRHSELRLTEALENACSNVLEYKVHKDKALALRYEKVESTTFKTLKGLKSRGVKVDLGFPDQMWDTPDAEITRLKSKCEEMVERYEDDITNWYYQLTDTNLTHWLCVEKSVLKAGEIECLNETATKTDKQKNRNKQEQGKKVKTENKKNAPLEKEKETGSLFDEQRKKEKTKQQADEKLQPRFSPDQFRRTDEKRRTSGMNQSKRSAFRDRLRTIKDPDRLRREIRKIRKNELTENDYRPIAFLKDGSNKDFPESASRDMRRRTYDQLEDIKEFRREIESRVADLNRNNDVVESVTLQEVLRLYSKDADEIRDGRELRKRLEDLDALVIILGDGEMHDEL